MKSDIGRRAFLARSVGVPAAAIAAAGASAQGEVEGSGPACALPRGRIKGMEVSRLLLGGNLLTHFTHSRDLKYVYRLTKEYNTPEKIMATLATAEGHGINTVVIHSDGASNIEPLKRYRKERGGKIQWIICPTADLATPAFQDQVSTLLDAGTEAIYLWGAKCDKAIADGRPEVIAQAVDMVQAHGVPCGVGAHDIEVVRYCESKSVPADFYIKTFHHHKYPTAPRQEQIKGPHSEIPGYWCSDPEALATMMAQVKKPWISFKVMAAGAIPPASAFKYAYEKGADFVLAGMFDFEIQEDAAVAQGILAALTGRTRPWMA